jgi:hypothetical protein
MNYLFQKKTWKKVCENSVTRDKLQSFTPRSHTHAPSLVFPSYFLVILIKRANNEMKKWRIEATITPVSISHIIINKRLVFTLFSVLFPFITRFI